MAVDTVYELTEQSNHIEGCFAPCMCPVWIDQPQRGNFRLRSISQDEGETIHVTESGLYRASAGRQRLTLDLVLDDSPVQHFDSGLVPWGGLEGRVSLGG